MKLREFTSTLRERKKVTFHEGHALEARADALARMIADSLTRLLPPNTEIHSGWETSALGDPWRGHHEWWLVASELVKIHATASTEKQPRTGKITFRAFPLHNAVPKVVWSYGLGLDERGEQGKLRSMELELLVSDGETLAASASGGSIDALVDFLTHLRAAISSAREGAAKGRKVTNGATR